MKLKKLTILCLTLLTLSSASQSHASVFSKAKDKWDDTKKAVEEFYDNELKEHVDTGIDATTDFYKDNLEKHVDAAADKADNLREKLSKKVKAFFASKSSTIVLNAEQFKNDVKLFYHCSAFITHTWETQKDALSISEASMNSLLTKITQTKAALIQIANNPQNTELTPEIIDSYQLTPDQVDFNAFCSLNSIQCESTLNDTFTTAVEKITLFHTQYYELFSEIILI